LAKPLLIGEWADIAVLQDGEDYYLVHSSGLYRPAVLIWHSKDLRTWRPLRYAVKEFDKGAIWVTDLAKVDGRYYIFFLNSFSWQSGGHVVTADAIDGPWSPPGPTGLHPDAVLAADDAGQRYLFTGSGYLTPLLSDRFESADKPQRAGRNGEAFFRAGAAAAIVRDFGAKGDGKTDDTAALRNPGELCISPGRLPQGERLPGLARQKHGPAMAQNRPEAREASRMRHRKQHASP
jgi:hypothetical protein